MRELFFKLFEMSHFNTGIQITPFSGAHIVYLLLIFGGIIGAWFAMRGQSAEKKENALRLLAYALVVSYLSDFFVHEFVYGGLNMDKLPFHICTVLCPLIAFAQFNRNGKKIAEPVAVLSVLAPMMYLCYPASVGTGEPWCYQALQTMFYHGVVMAWGILTIALGAVELQFKRVWKSGVLLVAITLWAKLGNVLMEHNWFFLEEDAFYIGLVANGVIPKWVLMIVNPLVFFLAVLAVYGVVYGLRTKGQKKAKV
jgi:uncharacterized membrane protein YwaF